MLACIGTSSRMTLSCLALWLSLLCLGSVMAAEPTISTVAGGCNDIDCDYADGLPATTVRLSWPRGVDIDGQGNLYIADSLSFRVLKVNRSGIISTIAGRGAPANYNGDGIPATQAGVFPWAVAVDATGAVFIADRDNARIRRVSPAGVISTVAGTGTHGYNGDDRSATSAALNRPRGVVVTASGELYILDQGNQRVRKVSAGVITTVTGNGKAGFNGDGIAATTAQLNNPSGIAVDLAGNLYIADTGNGRIRKVSPSGTISTIAGGGSYYADPLATNMMLLQPLAVAAGPRDEIYFTTPDAVHVVGAGGIVRTVAGLFDDLRGGSFYNPSVDDPNHGDGGPARQAALSNPEAIALDASGHLFIADLDHQRIRKVSPFPLQPLPVGAFALRPPTSIPLPGRFGAVATADVNGDGRIDVVVSTIMGRFSHDPAADMRIHILLQRSDGTLAPPVTLPYPVNGTSPTSPSGKLAIADFNNDGIADIAVAHELGVDVILGNRSGQFAIRSFTGSVTTSDALDIVAIDANRDGRMDVIVSTIILNQALAPGLRTHFGDGMGGSQHYIEERHGHAFSSMITGDFNGDGIQDLAYAYRRVMPDSHGIALRLHSGAWALHLPTEIPIPSASMPFALTPGDLDGDGRTDLVFSATEVRGAADHRSMLGWLAQNPVGQLSPPVYVPTYCSFVNAAIADINRDGTPDILMRGCGLAFMPTTGTGFGLQFKTPLPASQDNNERFMAVGDIDNDGVPDVIVAISGHGLHVHHGNRRLPVRHTGSQPLIPNIAASAPRQYTATFASSPVSSGAPVVVARETRRPVAARARHFFDYSRLRATLLIRKATSLLQFPWRSTRHAIDQLPIEGNYVAVDATAVLHAEGPTHFPQAPRWPSSAQSTPMEESQDKPATHRLVVLSSKAHWLQGCLPR